MTDRDGPAPTPDPHPPHTQTHTNTELHATAVSAFGALCGTMGALVFLNTTSPCDESSLGENERGTEREKVRERERHPDICLCHTGDLGELS